MIFNLHKWYAKYIFCTLKVGRGKSCLHPILPRLYLCDYIGYVVKLAKKVFCTVTHLNFEWELFDHCSCLTWNWCPSVLEPILSSLVKCTLHARFHLRKSLQILWNFCIPIFSLLCTLWIMELWTTNHIAFLTSSLNLLNNILYSLSGSCHFQFNHIINRSGSLTH